ncbi:MAG TPA: glycosyltransferase family 9 protein [Burkholderiales bacterium]|nr:glycosyltransferase family 9 protein [Burkholderiales bacterium]
MTLSLGAQARILVVRRDNIGDLVCTTPLIDALRARYPRAHLAALVNSYNAEVLEGNPALDAVHVYTKLKHRGTSETALSVISEKLRLFATLRRARFDCVLLAKSGFDRQGLALSRWIGPRAVVGFAPPGGGRARGLTDPVAPVAAETLHEVEVLARLGDALGVVDALGPLRAYPSTARVADWRARLPPLSVERKWIALHVSAREPGRHWPAEKFAALVAALAADARLGFVLLWAPGAADDPRHPGDDAKAQAIRSAVPAAVPLLAAPTARLADLTAILSLCDAFIGADGGALHLAAAVGLPTVALFENLEHKKRHWYPWKVPYELVAPATRDIADIAVEQVVAAWRRLEARDRASVMIGPGR